MDYKQIMKFLMKKQDVITVSPHYFSKKSTYRDKIHNLFYQEIGKKYSQFVTKLNNLYGTKLQTKTIDNGGIKFTELYSNIVKISGRDPKSATFVGELPGGAAVMFMFLFKKAKVVITSPINTSNNDENGDTDEVEFVGTKKVQSNSKKLEIMPVINEEVDEDENDQGGLVVNVNDDADEKRIEQDDIKIPRITSNPAYLETDIESDLESNPPRVTSNPAYLESDLESNPPRVISNPVYLETDLESNPPRVTSNPAYLETDVESNPPRVISNPAYLETDLESNPPRVTSNPAHLESDLESNPPRVTSDPKYLETDSEMEIESLKVKSDPRYLETESEFEDSDIESVGSYFKPNPAYLETESEVEDSGFKQGRALRYTNGKSVGDGDFLDDKYNIRKLPQWRSFDNAMIQNEDFKRELKTNPDLANEWLISDIGFEYDQEREQLVVVESFLEIVKEAKTKIASEGCLIKMYNFHKGKVLDALVELSAHYNSLLLLKPEGSSIANFEVYILLYQKMTLPDEGVDPDNLLKKRMEILSKTVEFYENYNKVTTEFPINVKTISNTIKFIVNKIGSTASKRAKIILNKI